MSDGITRFAVQDAALSKPPIDVTLPGRFTFDGLTADGGALYLLEWVGADHYQVRRYDVGNRALYGYPIVDKLDATEGPTSGTASGRGLVTGDGWMQLTPYVRAGGAAFVHALPLDAGFPFAFCLDLPGPGPGWALTAAPDGRTFYAVNAATGHLAEIKTGGADADAVPDLRLALFPANGVATLPAAVVGPDGGGLFAAGATSVVAIDTHSLGVRETLELGSPVRSLAFPMGGPLYALVPGHLLTVDPAARRVAVDLAVPPGFTAVARVA